MLPRISTEADQPKTSPPRTLLPQARRRREQMPQHHHPYRPYDVYVTKISTPASDFSTQCGYVLAQAQ